MKTAEDVLNEKDRPIIATNPDTTIADAIKTMVVNNIGAIVVKKAGKIVGIFTERDLLHHSAREGFDVKSLKLRDYMTEPLHFTNFDEPVYLLLDKMLGMRVRHLFVKKEEEILGILSIGDVMKACLNERTKELQSVSWEYYENWQWRKRRKK